jgi:hypothetical protein
LRIDMGSCLLFIQLFSLVLVVVLCKLRRMSPSLEAQDTAVTLYFTLTAREIQAFAPLQQRRKFDQDRTMHSWHQCRTTRQPQLTGFHAAQVNPWLLTANAISIPVGFSSVSVIKLSTLLTLLDTSRFSIALALMAGVLAAADALPLPDRNSITKREEATCRMKDPSDASGDPWRTGRCKTSKSACGLTGGEAFRYVQLTHSLLPKW